MPRVLISHLQFSFDFNLRFCRQMRCQLIICDLFHQGLFQKIIQTYSLRVSLWKPSFLNSLKDYKM